MAEIVTLSAKLDVVGAETYGAEMKKRERQTHQMAAAIDKMSYASEAAGKKVATSTQAVAASTNQLAGSIDSVMAFGAAIGIAFGVDAVIGFAKSVVMAGLEAEAVTNKLTAALRAQGITSTKTRDEIIAYSRALQQTSVYGDEAITEVQTLLIQLGRLSGKPLQDATRSTLDLASGLGIDLRSAALLVGKAAAGETSTLSRYGLVIADTGTKAEKFAAAMDAINSKFSGSSAAEVETAAGAFKQLGEAFGDLKEAASDSILPALEDAAKGIKSVVTAATDDSGGLTRFVAAILTLGNSEALRGFNKLKEDGGLLGDDTSASLAEERVNEVLQQRAAVLRELTDLYKQRDESGDELTNTTGINQRLAKLREINVELGIANTRVKDLADAGSTPGKPPIDPEEAKKAAAAMKKLNEEWERWNEQLARESEDKASKKLIAAAERLGNLAKDSLFSSLFAMPEEGNSVEKEIRRTEKAIADLQKLIVDGLDQLGAMGPYDPGFTAARDELNGYIADLKKLQAELAKTRKEKALGGGDLGEFVKHLREGGDGTFSPSEQPRALLGMAGDKLAGSLSGISSNIMGGAMQGAQVGGPMGAIAGAGLALLTSSKQFQSILESINPLLQSFADLFGSFLAPIAETLEPLATNLGRFFQAVTPIVELFFKLNPALATTIPIAKALGEAIRITTNWVIKGFIGFLKGINKVLKALGIQWKAIDDGISSLKRLRDSSDAAADAMSGFATSLPEGYKLLELRRYQETPAEVTYYGPTGVGTGGGLTDGGYSGSTGSGASSSGGGGVVVHGNIELHGIQDVPSLARALAGERRWRSTVRSGRAVYASGGA